MRSKGKYNCPNSTILGNVKNEYWDYKKVDDVGYLLQMMSLLFAVDTISVIVNSIILRKLADLNLLQVFCRTIKKYWLFIALKHGLNFSLHYALNDINLGVDTTTKFEWIMKKEHFNLSTTQPTYQKEKSPSCYYNRLKGLTISFKRISYNLTH